MPQYPILIKRRQLVFGGFTLFLLLCAAQDPQPNIAITQGIEGYIYRVEGNQMPMKGASKTKKKGIAREIYIYSAATARQATGRIPVFSHIHTKFFLQSKSDSVGHYQVSLPIGKYSIMVKEGNQFFANETDGNGVLNPANVIVDKMTKRDITINLGAVY